RSFRPLLKPTGFSRWLFSHVEALRGFLPQLIIERKTKAEFSVMFHRFLDEIKDLFTYSLPMKRTDWVDPDGLSQLYINYERNAPNGWPQWILWSIFGCDIFVTHATKRTASFITKHLM
ncbi:MAG: hypothetical protein P9F75_13185, partial [Candidatus Contendobacter sp.]|nr:hypothetical protein [Candidatus Contendobacter sp.]